MREPGTKIINQTYTTRHIDDIVVAETVSEWNDTDGISVDYNVEGIDIHADKESMTSFDEPLTDSELRTILADLGFPVGAGEQ